jgi:hypothetical protein
MSPFAHETAERPESSERDNGHVEYRPNDAGGSARITPGSIWRHPFLILVPTILLLAAGIYVGNRKHPNYSAVATINVGKSDINTQATPGYLQASIALASTYSRLVNSQHVEVPAARSLHESPTALGSALSAVPIPDQPTFTVTATGQSPGAAVQRALATVAALQTFVDHSATQQGNASDLLSRYQRAQAQADRLQLKSSTLAARRSLQLPGGPSDSKVAAAKLAGQVASLKAQSLSGAYMNLAQNGGAPTLDVLIDPTSSSSSNRTSNIEKYGVIGGVAGLTIGLALAGLVTSLQTRRRSRQLTA